MQALIPLILAAIPSALAIIINQPASATKGVPFDLTWSPDADNIVFYITSDAKSFTQLGTAATKDRRVTVVIPNTVS